MARYNKAQRKGPVVNQPIRSAMSPTARTGNNAVGSVRDPKSELFLLAVSNFVGQDKHYESGVASDERYKMLIRSVAVSDPDWIKRFLPWLRNEANMRTASIVGTVEAVRAMIAAGIPGGRQLVYFVLTRADEAGEMIGYLRQLYGPRIPKPIKRGIADAVQGFYGEYQALKYDTESKEYRFGDVIELTHARPRDAKQSVLFKHLIDRRHKRDAIPSSLTMMHANAKLREQSQERLSLELFSPESLREAGMTWEDTLSLAGSRMPKKELWESIIPNMNYGALIKNLRNFDQAGVGDVAARYVMDKLSDPHQVQGSRLLPMRFLSAYRAVSNVRWHYPLEQALQHSLANIPVFSGRTLILIDTSYSMHDRLSEHSELLRWDAAAIFGLAVSQRCEQADVISFSDRTMAFPLAKGSSLLVMLEAFRRGYFQNRGTDTVGAVAATYRGHDRVIILTDEQANEHNHADALAAIPANIPVITFNLAGYKVGHAASGTPTRITIGGLSDQAFKLLPVFEGRGAGQWPF